ncbi:HNH endonuclease family protein [Micromonospora sonneratiae]|uniref:HNH endonuclease family protein n=1 Tax=Micromonospora sonneratiae TaxID=1184706 RepID=A0ABW3YAJ6_9ACTN
MSHSLRLIATTAAATITGTTLVAGPARADTYQAPLRTAVASLPVADENRTGYDRGLFPHWIDADRDGCNTRNEVLISEATTAPTVGAGCSLSGGRWYSYYDDAYWTLPADLDIDHMVPLAEAWDSGAGTWSSPRRKAYANDLGDRRSLVAVTDNVNQAKGDKDPAEWLPPNQVCRYVREWTVVKKRWSLAVDPAEYDALMTLADGCPNITITVSLA